MSSKEEKRGRLRNLTVVSSSFLVLNKLITLATVGYVTKFVGLAFLGEWQTVRNFWFTCRLFTDLAFDPNIIRTKDPSKETVELTVMSKLYLSIITLPIGLAVTLLVFGIERQDMLGAFLFGSFVLFDGFAWTYFAVCRSRLQLIREGIWFNLRSVFSFAVVMAIYFFHGNSSYLLLATISGQAVFGLWYLVKNWNLKIPFQKIIEFIKTTKSIHFVTILGFLFQRTDLLILPLLTDYKKIGEFSLFYKIPAEIVALGANFSSILVSKMTKSDRAKQIKYIYGSLFLILIGIFLLSVLFWVAMKFLPAEYAASLGGNQQLLQLSIWLGGGTIIINVLNGTCYVFNMEKKLIAPWGIAILLQVFLCKILYDTHQIVGFTMGQIITTFVLIMSMLVIIYSHLLKTRESLVPASDS